MKKVLILIPDLRGGGAERVVVNLVNNFKSKDYKITLMTLFKSGVNQKYLNKDVDYKYWLPFRIRGIWRFFKYIQPHILHKWIVKEQYDFEIAYLEGISTKIISGGSFKTKKIAWIHCELDGKEEYFFELYKSLNEFKETYCKFDRIVGVSDEILKSFGRVLPEIPRKEIVHNVVDSEQINKLKEEFVDDIVINNEKINFVTVGRLVPQKGYGRLIKIFFDLCKEYNNIELYILGEGPLKKVFLDYIKQNDMESIHIMGYKSNPYKYINLMDCFICSSFQEGFSTAATEAIIVGKPIITTSCSGSSELCSDGAGILCDKSDDSLKEAIESFVQSSKMRQNLNRNICKSQKRLLMEHSLMEFERLLEMVANE